MKYLKRFFLLAIVVLLGIFAFRNQNYLGQRVDLVFITQPVSLVLGFWLILCFLLGLLVYMILDLPSDIALKRDLHRKSQDIARLQFELSRMQASAPTPPPPPPPPPPDPDLEKRLGL